MILELTKRLSAVSWDSDIPLYEVIFVDDGSRDKTLALLSSIAQKDARFKIISFSRNFGHQIAVSAGLEHAGGEAVVIIDGDLQDPPELIPKMARVWKDGNDVVYAVRKERKELKIKIALYAIFYRVMRYLAEIDIPLDSGDFSLMDRKVVDVIVSMPERARFVRGLRAWAGFRTCAFPYERSARSAGETKYSFRKLLNLALSGVVGFSTMPLRLATYMGVTISAVSFSAGLFVFLMKLFGFVENITVGWSSLLVTLFFVSGIQLFILGVIGEYIGAIFKETQHRPLYIVKDKIGF